MPNKTAFVGDVGLTGEIKRVPSTELRIKELNRMGFKKVYISQEAYRNLKNIDKLAIEICPKKYIREIIRDIFK